MHNVKEREHRFGWNSFNGIRWSCEIFYKFQICCTFYGVLKWKHSPEVTAKAVSAVVLVKLSVLSRNSFCRHFRKMFSPNNRAVQGFYHISCIYHTHFNINGPPKRSSWENYYQLCNKYLIFKSNLNPTFWVDIVQLPVYIMSCRSCCNMKLKILAE